MKRSKYENWLKKGFLEAELSKYEPFIRTYDFSSKGNSYRPKGIKTNRIHHLLSKLEYNYFLGAEYSQVVKDIREQFPLEPRETEKIANDFEYKHPKARIKGKGTYENVVMTTDFLLTVHRGNKKTFLARSIKPYDMLSLTNLKKFEIEQNYWKRRGVDWGVVTEKELPSELFLNNLEDLRMSYLNTGINNGAKHCEFFFTVLSHYQEKKQSSIFEFASYCANLMKMEEGYAYSLLKAMIFLRIIRADLSIPLVSNPSLNNLNFKIYNDGFLSLPTVVA